jgi:hypothetical protein
MANSQVARREVKVARALSRMADHHGGRQPHPSTWPSQYAGPFFISTFGLVSRFRSSHHYAARSIANFGIEGHQHLIDLVWLWFRSPHFGLAAEMMRTSEPPH